MRLLISLSLGVALFIATPDPAHSQTFLEQDTEVPIPVPGTRSPVAAGFLEYLFPTAGFAYGGAWRRGLLPNAVRIGGVVLTLSSLRIDFFGDDSECSGKCEAGLALMAVGAIWAIAGAVDATKDFNDRLREGSARVTISPSVDGGLSLGLRVFR